MLSNIRLTLGEPGFVTASRRNTRSRAMLQNWCGSRQDRIGETSNDVCMCVYVTLVESTLTPVNLLNINTQKRVMMVGIFF